jgi:hypothetical protein
MLALLLSQPVCTPTSNDGDLFLKNVAKVAGFAEMVRQIQLLFAHFVVGHGTLPPKRGKPSAKPGPLQLQIALTAGQLPLQALQFADQAARRY